MATADNLLNTTQNFLTPDFIRKFSSTLGQPADKIQIGLRSVIPTFLLGLVKKGSSREGAEQILSVVSRDGVDTPNSINFNDPEYLRKGEEAINKIFGNSLVPMTDQLQTTTGMNSSVIAKIMSMIAPMVMGVIGKKVKGEGLSANGLVTYLGQQKNALAGYIPGAVVGARSEVPPMATSLKGAIANTTKNQIVTDYPRPSSKPWALIGLVALLFLGGLWWYLNRQQPVAPTGVATISSSSVTPTSTIPEREVMPAAANLNELENFLRSGNVGDIPKRFRFETLNFSVGSTTMVSGSQMEIDEIANTLKEFPQVTARIEGFTDNTGNAAQNTELSTARAVAVKEELKARGIAESRIEAVGRGPEAPVASNESEEGRAQNRRIEFIVTNL